MINAKGDSLTNYIRRTLLEDYKMFSGNLSQLILITERRFER